jgi:hypothetical protein
MAPARSLSYLTTALSKGKAMLNQNAIIDVRAASKGSAKLLLIGSGGLAGTSEALPIHAW